MVCGLKQHLNLNPSEPSIMKVIITTLAAVAIAAGSAVAGCGKVDTTKGKLESFDAESKKVVVDVGDTKKTLTLTPKAKGADKTEKLVGKEVTVLSEHGKITEIGK